ncbi:MAG: DUF4942 domain-containing protein, partial [Armatimonadia bacterium]
GAVPAGGGGVMLNAEFFPTPAKLISRILAGINWGEIETVLEPQGGKGDIAAKVALRIAHERNRQHYRKETDGKGHIDCIELDPDLRNTLKGAGFRVVHDDFLTYHTRKHYDLIVSNPPFSDGARHLLKALELAQYGGIVRCLLNAETIRNQCTFERKALARKLEDLGAEIEFLAGEFAKAERPTDVEIALVKVTIPNSLPDSIILEDLREAQKVEAAKLGGPTDIAPGDFVQAIVARYRYEVDAGVRLIHEYQRIEPHLLDAIHHGEDGADYRKPILSLTIDDRKAKGNILNDYVRLTRLKYWQALFEAPEFTGQLTSNLQKELAAKVEALGDYEFSRVNILSIQRDLSTQTIASIEETILAQFDRMSRQHSFQEGSANVHYFNGWCTNKAWKINDKVILPGATWDKFFGWRFWRIGEEMRDLEKCLAFLNGGLPPERGISQALHIAEQTGCSFVGSSFFDVTFYKKGTCHIRFTRADLLNRLNIFGAQRKHWLPPSYGKRKYADMDTAERAVVDEFEGEASYAKVVADPGNYIIEPSGMLQLTGGAP